MKPSNISKSSEILSHPMILKAAWMRVDAWYRSAEFEPQPELSRWRLNPEGMLKKLANELMKDSWRPDVWRQVPYPKKGQRLRHYLMPTVRDQVAFMAHMVLLGPIFDQKIANFAFGNRWYRPIMWDRRARSPRWKLLSCPLLSDKTYLPYPRAHGLFRRVAHWTIARMTHAELSSGDEVIESQRPDDYSTQDLPEWTQEKWWENFEGEPRAFWAALDIELAFPSVEIETLKRAALNALDDSPNFDQLMDGYPSIVMDSLRQKKVRKELARRLTNALANIRIQKSGIPFASWGPPKNHPLPQMSKDSYDRIPTGLAISGMLLNVVLLEADRKIQDYLISTSGSDRGAFVRFSDDMYLLSRSEEGLLALIEVVHCALSGTEASSLAIPNRESNICVNFQKIRPDPTREIVAKYLQSAGWSLCEECGQPIPPDESPKGTYLRLVDWWQKKLGKEKLTGLRRRLTSTAIEKGDIGPFVTDLVERLSDLGNETLMQRFGEGAKDYLSRLHELARFDIEDEQVKPETRRAFAINRLVRAWLPISQQAVEEQQALKDIRRTIGYVIEAMPWKFSTWRAAVRAAARRPINTESCELSDNQVGSEWLASQLRRICSYDEGETPNRWLTVWPDEDEAGKHFAEWKNSNWRNMYVSFLRTVFWHALAEVITDLRRHAFRETHVEDYRSPSPDSWTTRAMAEGKHTAVASELGKIDKWTELLYPKISQVKLEHWPWELDALTSAVLATHRSDSLAKAWNYARSPRSLLRVPITSHLDDIPYTEQLLKKSGRLVKVNEVSRKSLSHWKLSNISFGYKSKKLEKTLFPTPNSTILSQKKVGPRGIVAAALSLDCHRLIGLRIAERALPSLKTKNLHHRNGFDLRDYERARILIVGQKVNAVQQPTLHRLLWGEPRGVPLRKWRMAPWNMPSLGLPVRVAARLFVSSQEAKPPKKWKLRDGPLNWRIDDKNEILSSGRLLQFGRGDDSIRSAGQTNVTRTTKWEVMPHAAFYLPFVNSPVAYVNKDSYLLYCDVLLLLTALDGNEAILNSLVKSGVKGTPFEDRWAWRSRIHLPIEAWQSIDEILRWSENPISSLASYENLLYVCLKQISCRNVSAQDFLSERIDVSLSSRDDVEVIRTIQLSGQLNQPNLPEELCISDDLLEDQVVVRVGQVTSWPNPKTVLDRFPQLPASVANKMIGQISNVFHSHVTEGEQSDFDLVILPELSVPLQEVRSLRNLAEQTRKAVVAGIYWRKLNSALRPINLRKQSTAYFVNEAELIVPLSGRRGPPAIRWFRIRKPVPAHMEDGLAESLSNKTSRKWQMLRGRQWYRFLHPGWGDFSVAICADLIDSAPWRSLRGELLHLFMVAFNKDVELFDSLTWVRAYETYVNLASVNHGTVGGSFVWTPQRSHDREIARLRGNKLVLTADVQLTVKEMFQAQKNGVKQAITDAAANWATSTNPSSKFKSPPPGYVRRGSSGLEDSRNELNVEKVIYADLSDL